MSSQTRGLGKGLNAILGEIPSADNLRDPIGYVNKEIAGSRAHQGTADILRIPIDKIQPNPYQPRLSFSEESLNELTESIRALGLIQPITVRSIADGKYQIISGERRYKACRLAGLTMIPAYVRDADDQGMIEMAIVENIQRENLDPIEVALSYRRLITECNLTQDAMAARLGKKRSSVANQLRLLNLPPKVQHDLKVGQISVGHAKVLLSIDDEDVQEKLCDITVRENLNVRQLEKRIAGLNKAATPATPAPALSQTYQDYVSRLNGYFSNGAELKPSRKGGGSITIRFSSDEELEGFFNALKKD